MIQGTQDSFQFAAFQLQSTAALGMRQSWISSSSSLPCPSIPCAVPTIWFGTHSGTCTPGAAAVFLVCGTWECMNILGMELAGWVMGLRIPQDSVAREDTQYGGDLTSCLQRRCPLKSPWLPNSTFQVQHLGLETSLV